MMTWLLRHLQTLLGATGDLVRSPFSSIMSISVIAIALALPGGLYAALENINQITIDFEHGAKISLFLRPGVSVQQGHKLAKELADHADLKHIELITPQQAMQEFKQRSGLTEALDALQHNPLPVVLLAFPQDEVAHSPERLNALVDELGELQPVELSQFDLEWIKRLNALLKLAQRAVWIIAVVLALGVFLIIGNTIRMSIANHREEIGIVKLIGGTDSFIRRPYLYTGMFLGLSGGLAALAIIELLFAFISTPASHVSLLYSTQFILDGLHLWPAMALVCCGALLGWLSARITVGVYLRHFEPGGA